MSDQQDKNTEQVAEETAAADDALQESAELAQDEAPVPAPPPSAPAEPAPAPPPSAPAEPAPAPVTRKGGSSAVGWLALILVLALAAGAAWLLREQQYKETTVLNRLQQLETIAGGEQADLDKLGERWQGQLNTGLGELEGELQGGLGELEGGLGELSNETERLKQSIQSLEAQLAEQRAELVRYSANDRESWLMAEAQYLLRLANQRLIMAGDAKAAGALLASADKVLREMDEVDLYPVRAAVAADLAAVKAVPSIDVEGIYLRLAALIGQADRLVIFQLPEQEQQPQAGQSDSWQARLRRGYEEALEKVSSYVIIRRRDVPMTALMDPQWEGLVRQNLRMLLEQAQVALLSKNQTLYRESLQRAQYWVGEFFESDEAAARSMASEITQLEGVDIAVTLPDIAGSMRSLDDALKQRLQQGGGE